MKKKVILLVIFLVEIFIFIISAILYSNKEKININISQEEMQVNTGSGVREAGFYFQWEQDKNGVYCVSPVFPLEKGRYTITIKYEMRGHGRSAAMILFGGRLFEENASGVILLEENYNEISYDVRVNEDQKKVEIRNHLSSESEDSDYLLIREIQIKTSELSLRYFLFKELILFLFIDILLFLFCKRKKFALSAENKFILCGIVSTIVLTSIPVMANYLTRDAHDLTFHLMRIEGIKDGLLSGAFPVKIQPTWLNGHGYAVSVFYGDLFLYIPAILRAMGVGITNSYRIYIFIVNTATVFISYVCFSRISRNKYMGLMGAVLYSTSIYRLVNLYTRAAVGEYTAMVFIPIILYGLWKIFTEDTSEKKYKRNWILLSLGYSGLILSHVISCEMAGFFTIIICLLLWKKTFKKATFMVLLKTVLATLLLNLWFLIPFLDYMRGEWIVNRFDASLIPARLMSRTVYLSQLFMSKFNVFAESISIENGIEKEMSFSIGFAFLLVIGVFLAAGKFRSEKERKTAYLCLGLSIFALFLTTNLCRYDILCKWIPSLRTVLRVIQYPWRFLAIGVLLLTWLACETAKKLEGDVLLKKGFMGIVCIIALYQGVSYQSEVLDSAGPWFIYENEGIGTFATSGGEYLPYNSNIEDYKKGVEIIGEGIIVDDFEREHNSLIISVKNDTASKQAVELPLIHYEGYYARESETGKRLEIIDGDSKRIRVEIEPMYQGTIEIAFREHWYWRGAELISVFSLCGFWAVLFMYNKNKSDRKSK